MAASLLVSLQGLPRPTFPAGTLLPGPISLPTGLATASVQSIFVPAVFTNVQFTSPAGCSVVIVTPPTSNVSALSINAVSGGGLNISPSQPTIFSPPNDGFTHTFWISCFNGITNGGVITATYL